RSRPDDFEVDDRAIRGGGNDQILKERADRQHHFAVRRINFRQPSCGVGPDPHLPLIEPDSPRLGVVTAGSKRGVVEDAVKIRWNERRRRRSRRLLDVLANDSFRAEQFHRDTPRQQPRRTRRRTYESADMPIATGLSIGLWWRLRDGKVPVS